jgi:predicted outer membrane protein
MDVRCTLGAACALLIIGAMTPTHAQKSADKTSQAAKSTLSKGDQRYFDDLAKANLAEIQSGKVAQTKASSAEVKQFAQHMVDDHGKKFEEQRSMAKAKNVALPAAPDDKHKDAMKKMERLSGAEFDRAYMGQMVKDHETTLQLVQDIAKKADDSDLKAAAQKAMPDIQKHLETAKRLAGDTKAPAKVGMSK